MNAFAISIEFQTPAIFGRRLNLDAILANLLYQQARYDGMDELSAIEHAHSNIPLAFHEGIAAGSCALIPTCNTHPVTLVSSFPRHLNAAIGAELSIRRNETTRKNGRIFDGIASPIMNRYEAHEVDQPGMSVRFLARGDRAQVEALLKPIVKSNLGLGKKRSIGYGKVRAIRFDSLPDHRYFGLMSRNGTILRAIPQTVVQGFTEQPQAYAMAFETVRPPYWKTEQILCFVPPKRMWNDELYALTAEG